MTDTRTADVFQQVNDLDPATVRRLIDRMEARRHDPRFTGWREAYLDQVGLTHAQAVLEVGCGSGAVARAIAARPGVGARIVATDYSAALVTAGQELAAGDRLGDRIEFAVQDCQALDLPDRVFDVTIAHTVFSHVADPVRALSELSRVTRPGGTVVVFDGDYASLAFGGGRGPDQAGVIVRALVATVAANPTVLRELPAIAAAVGLACPDVTAHVLAEVGSGEFFTGFAETYAPIAAGAGAAPAGLVSSWLEDQRRAAHAGSFFASCNYYTYLLRQP